MIFRACAIPIALVFFFASAARVTYSSAPSPEDKKKNKEAKGKKSGKEKKARKSPDPSSAPATPGTPALRTDRGSISTLDLYWGIGARDLAPKPPFTFEKEDTSGTNPKIKVTDANGVKWIVKFDEEVHSEAACTRLVWAVGYMVEENYFIPSGKVNGVKGLDRSAKFVKSDGSFTAGLFEKRPDDVARRAIDWAWDANPFKGTKELSGLIIMAVMLNNWDAKESNNAVFGMFDEAGKVKDYYVVSDWGGTLGKMGGFTSHSKWDTEAFAKQGFIERVSGGTLTLHYSGKGGSAMKEVPLEHARWFAAIVGRLSDHQIREAFRAAGASESDKAAFSARIREKINELKSATGVR
jgi:hypothetical protein